MDTDWQTVDWEDRLERERPADVLRDIEAAERALEEQGLPSSPILLRCLNSTRKCNTMLDAT